MVDTKEDIEKLAQEAGLDCIEALLDEVRQGKGASRVAAVKALLERGYGRGAGKDASKLAEVEQENTLGSEETVSPVIRQALAALRAECGIQPEPPSETPEPPETFGQVQAAKDVL